MGNNKKRAFISHTSENLKTAKQVNNTIQVAGFVHGLTIRTLELKIFWVMSYSRPLKRVGL